MRLMLSGKGGAGKSTVTALLARGYAAAGKRVVVLDTDVSNLGLHRLLGTDAPPDLTGLGDGMRAGASRPRPGRRTRTSPGAPRPGSWTFDTFPEGYRSLRDGVMLVRAGKIRDATEYGKGRWLAAARRFLLGLSLAEDDRVLIDTDAGVEHLGRGFGPSCDAMLAVVDPSRESVLIAEKMARMMAPERVPLYAVLNKTDPVTSRALRRALSKAFRILGEFPRDPGVAAAGFEGRALPEGLPAAVALVKRVETIRAGLRDRT